MRFITLCSLSLLALTAISDISGAQSGQTLSTGAKVDLTKQLKPESPTVFVFIKSNSSLERDFLKTMQKEAGSSIGLGVVALKTGQEPVAAQYGVTETPTALVYDRRGRLVTRSSNADDIHSAIRKAAGVMRIDWANDGDANFQESVRLLGRSPGTGILRTMTLQPTYLKFISDLSQKAHFSDGFLKRRVKEMIATYVSQLNHCKY